jgi:hypothetical protein
MSNRAVLAYETGEMPKSKWTKSILVEAITDARPDIPTSKLNQVNLNILQTYFLEQTSWHHTGKYYNETVFYSLDEESIANLTYSLLDQLIDRSKEARARNKANKSTPEPVRHVRCSITEWEGTRAHPKPCEFEVDGEIRGNWFYYQAYDGVHKKNLKGKYIDVIEYYD